MPYKSREAQRKYQRERNARIRREWLAIHGPCALCGSAENLQVDHLDPALKVSHRIWSWSTVRRDAELSKCQVLCRSCHKAKSDALMRRPIVHGTHSGYSYHGCRCGECVDGHAAYNRAWVTRAHAA